VWNLHVLKLRGLLESSLETGDSGTGPGGGCGSVCGAKNGSWETMCTGGLILGKSKQKKRGWKSAARGMCAGGGRGNTTTPKKNYITGHILGGGKGPIYNGGGGK